MHVSTNANGFPENGVAPVHRIFSPEPSPSDQPAAVRLENHSPSPPGHVPDSVAASGRLAEVFCHQAAILLPGEDNPQPDHVQLEYSSELIKLMQPFSTIEDLVRQHYRTSQVLTVAAPLVLGSLPHVKAMLDQKDADVEVIVRTINENTLRPFVVDASTTATNFHELFTGRNLRWEYIGFLLTCAGRSAMTGQANRPDFTNAYGTIINCKTFVHEMMMASRTCFALCRQNGAVVNDILIWLLYKNLIFSSMYYGVSSAFIILYYPATAFEVGWVP